MWARAQRSNLLGLGMEAWIPSYSCHIPTISKLPEQCKEWLIDYSQWSQTLRVVFESFPDEPFLQNGFRRTPCDKSRHP